MRTGIAYDFSSAELTEDSGSLQNPEGKEFHT